MTRLTWNTSEFVVVDGQRITCSGNLADQGRWKAGIRRDMGRRFYLRSAGWRALMLRNAFLGTGFIDRIVGGWIHKHARSNTTFLEIGCGAMNLERYLPRILCYNAFDLSLSEFHLRRLIRRQSNVNIALASVSSIPLDSDVSSLIVSTQVLEYVPEVSQAVKEIRRVASPHAIFACSIGNGYCYKYKIKGPHHGHVNFWTFDAFVRMMTKSGFRLLEGRMLGLWIPIPQAVTDTSYTLPISAREEQYNTHLLYLFEVLK